MKQILCIILFLLLSLVPANAHLSAQEVPVFITIGQSNADGSALFNPDEDARLRAWYASPLNHGHIKIWYRSSKVVNESNALGEDARHCVDGDTVDAPPGWMQLWYRNENALGRTAMNMIHGYGTYSTGSGTDCAQGRRGMEGEFGMRFAKTFPEKELYILKLGVSGSHISSWANQADNTNWNYFFSNVFKPAVDNLLAQGKRPVLAGIWWMQGCSDRHADTAYYEKSLKELVEKCRRELGFPKGRFYIGRVVRPGENPEFPGASAQFGLGVRQAQDAVAAHTSRVEIIDTRKCSFQNEPGLGGYVHFDHKGVNRIGQMLAGRVAADAGKWVPFTTPGTWRCEGGSAIFVPSVGNPRITYTTSADTVTATLVYHGWSETKTFIFGD